VFKVPDPDAAVAWKVSLYSAQVAATKSSAAAVAIEYINSNESSLDPLSATELDGIVTGQYSVKEASAAVRL
jgi:hypothetical protein